MTVRNLVLQVSNFDFNKTDMAFIKSFVASKYGDKAKKTIDAFRDWLKFQAYAKVNSIYYDARVNEEGGSVTNLTEVAIISVEGVEVMQMEFSRELKQVVDKRKQLGATYYEPADIQQFLTQIDASIEMANKDNDRKHRSIYHSLRPLMVEAASAAATVVSAPKEKPFHFTFLIEDGDYYYTAELMLNIDPSSV